jgi:hypothetical protein
MADFVIPTRTDLEDYEVEVELGEASFLLRFTWNYRSEYWFMTVSDTDANVIAGGIKVVVGKPLLAEVPHADKPASEILAVDTSDADLDPGLTDLGDRVLLFWNGA